MQEREKTVGLVQRMGLPILHTEIVICNLEFECDADVMSYQNRRIQLQYTCCLSSPRPRQNAYFGASLSPKQYKNISALLYSLCDNCHIKMLLLLLQLIRALRPFMGFRPPLLLVDAEKCQ